MTDRALIQAANESRKQAYAPYSRFAVGAALLSADGRVFVGCNIENASYGATLCAERAAFAAAIAQGCCDFHSIAVVGGHEDDPMPLRPCPPCGICRQVMRELCGDDFRILLSDGENILKYSLEELLPGGFSEKELR